MVEYTLVERLPTVAEYQRLRQAVGWHGVDISAAEKGLSNSLFSVCLINNGEIIGCGRVVGDGGVYLYIQDIIVIPPFQGRGIGKIIMERVMTFIESHASWGTVIGLMAAENVSGFYQKFGFIERPANKPGMFQIFNFGTYT